MSLTATPPLGESDLRSAHSSAANELVVLYVGAALLFLTVLASLRLFNNTLISRLAPRGISTTWSQAQHHVEIFGFLGTLVIGASFCWLVQRKPDVLLWPGRICFVLWTLGVGLRLSAGLYPRHWPVLLVASALLQAVAFLLLARSIIQCRAWRILAGEDGRPQLWTLILLGSGCGFAGALTANLYESVRLALTAHAPIFPHAFDTALLIIAVWGFLAPMAWGISAAFLPELLALKPIRSRLLIAACVLDVLGSAAAIAGRIHLAAVLLLHAAIFAPSSVRAFGKSQRPVTEIAHPGFIRLAYVWLRVAATLGVWASVHDRAPIWAASRHLLIVGFVYTSVLVLFEWAVARLSGTRLRFNARATFAAMLLLNIGCALQAISGILSGQGYLPRASHVLPLAAAVELGAVLLFVYNVAVGMLNAEGTKEMILNAERAKVAEVAEEI
ncbi:MAG: hypothetical protein ACE14M_15815 [Terriglobales bacterium]